MIAAMDIKMDCPKMIWLPLCWLALSLSPFTFAGCAWLMRPPEVDPFARQLVERLRQVNRGLMQYKALSRIQLDLEGVTQEVSPMAIAAQWPNRMRVEILSPAGQPVSSLVADGETIRIRTHGKKRIYRFHQSVTALEPLIHLPIGIAQLQGALIGRPALPMYAGVQVVSRTDDRIKVVLKNRWRQDLAVLHFNGDDRSVRRMEVLGEQGQSLYRVIWLQWLDIGKYRVPDRLRFESDSGYQVTVRIRRFWPDADLAAATFELHAPD